ncbi:MAG: photosynthetic complex assembly protein PuhC [Pseudomonadota bacterium]
MANNQPQSSPGIAPTQAPILIPKGVLIAASLLLAFVVSVAAFYRIAGIPPGSQVPAPDATARTMPFLVEDGENGQVIISNPSIEGDQTIKVIEYGEGGFIRGVMRGLARTRRAHHIGKEHPFLLMEQSNGRLILEDPQLSHRIELTAFGPDNVAAFRELLGQDDFDA